MNFQILNNNTIMNSLKAFFTLSIITFVMFMTCFVTPEQQTQQCTGIEQDQTPLQQPLIFDDIDESDLIQLSSLFHFTYNEPIEDRIIYPVEGVVYGNNRRVLFPMIVSHSGNRIKTLFLYDTSSPFSYISQSTLKALKIDNLVLNSMNIALQGDLVTVHPSPPQYRHINIVGQEFFRGLKALVAIDYFKLKAKIFLQGNAHEELETRSSTVPPSIDRQHQHHSQTAESSGH